MFVSIIHHDTVVFLIKNSHRILIQQEFITFAYKKKTKPCDATATEISANGYAAA